MDEPSEFRMNDAPPVDITTAARRRLLASLAVAVIAALGACDRSPPGPETAAAEQPAEKTAGEQGAAAETPSDDRFRAVVEPAEIEAGSKTDVTLELRAGEGLKVNEEYPNWSLEFSPPKGVELASPTFEAEAFSLGRKAARVETTLQASKPGSSRLDAVANFSVCNDDRCHILRDEPVSFQVEVAGGEGAAASDQRPEDNQQVDVP